ncbi:hypothetical protein KDA08_03415, partial [Candidatus Saccharibacteria bacterium]|nr:hypothetical protein [Candidatus Saccharibacteria bacterium]
DNWVNNVLYWHPGLPLPTDSFIDHYQEHRAAFTLPCIVDMSKDDYAFELQRSTDHFQLLCEKSVITTEKIVKIAKLALKNVDSYMGDAWIGDPSIISDYKQRLGRLATK